MNHDRPLRCPVSDEPRPQSDGPKKLCRFKEFAFPGANRMLGTPHPPARPGVTLPMIRKLKSGEYRLYSRKVDPKTGKRRNLGTFASRAAAEKHEREVQYFKRH